MAATDRICYRFDCATRRGSVPARAKADRNAHRSGRNGHRSLPRAWVRQRDGRRHSRGRRRLSSHVLSVLLVQGGRSLPQRGRDGGSPARGTPLAPARRAGAGGCSGVADDPGGRPRAAATRHADAQGHNRAITDPACSGTGTGTGVGGDPRRCDRPAHREHTRPACAPGHSGRLHRRHSCSHRRLARFRGRAGIAGHDVRGPGTSGQGPQRLHRSPIANSEIKRRRAIARG